jgi:hypothetical protein
VGSQDGSRGGLNALGGWKLTEADIIKSLFIKLIECPIQQFPTNRGSLIAPFEPGVYVIYGPRKKVLYVGRTPRGIGGLRQRLVNHLHGMSSFTKKYLGGDGSKLRTTCGYRFVIVKNPRHRALLEYYATGCLCPAHLGLGEVAIYRLDMPHSK